MGGGELATGECREMGQEAAIKGYRERHRREKGIRRGQGRKERVGVLAFFFLIKKVFINRRNRLSIAERDERGARSV